MSVGLVALSAAKNLILLSIHNANTSAVGSLLKFPTVTMIFSRFCWTTVLISTSLWFFSWSRPYRLITLSLMRLYRVVSFNVYKVHNNEVICETLYNSVHMIEFTLRHSWCTWFVQMHFSGTLPSIGFKNGSETRFQTPKLYHATAPISLFRVANQYKCSRAILPLKSMPLNSIQLTPFSTDWYNCCIFWRYSKLRVFLYSKVAFSEFVSWATSTFSFPNKSLAWELLMFCNQHFNCSP